MSLIKANENDDLNVVLNTPTDDALSVILPDGVVYNTKLFVKRSRLTVKGGNGSLIVWNDHNGMVPGFGTADSASVTVLGSDVSFENVGFANSFDYMKNREERNNTGMGLQAVAVYVAKEAGNVSFSSCSFDGWQDTLFVDGKNVKVSHCTISGNVDFIFGAADCVFDSCTIISKPVSKTLPGYVSAPSTPEENTMGLRFVNCRLEASDGVCEGSVYLARPWHPGGRPGVNSCAVFESCTLGKHINSELWTTMKDSRGVLHYPAENRFCLK